MDNEYYNGILCYINCNYLCYNIDKNITSLLIHFQRSLLTFLRHERIYVTKGFFLWQSCVENNQYIDVQETELLSSAMQNLYAKSFQEKK